MMKYNLGQGIDKNWIVAEDCFDRQYLGKSEAIMSLGNGYLGIRSATEEKYTNEQRDTFVAGTFNKFDEYEVTELPNVADVIQMDIKINDENLDLTRGTLKDYSKSLNLKTGELNRSFIWISEANEEVLFEFKRFASIDNLHLIGQKISITPLSNNVKVSITSGINGQVTNTGVQHFSEGIKRLYDKKYMQLVQTTTQSKICFVINSSHEFSVNNNSVDVDQEILMDRRKIFSKFTCEVEKGSKLVLEKISNINTSRDKEHENLNEEELRDFSLEQIKAAVNKGYNSLFEDSVKALSDKLWSQNEVVITGSDYDQLAIRFAQYHILVMSPIHDNRMNIGAKGLSGEGYKGHTFWDTEIFLLPYFTYTNPAGARSLLEYRYNTLKGAHKKAKENGYEGAMFPWESAWLEDGEVTPVWGAADIITGKSTKIWSGFIEQHITSDIAFACWQYYQITKDEDFMDKYGYELLLDTAKFWQSRLEWSEEKQVYEINCVIGPDEYKEHVNNNAFTNYTAHWTIKNAIEYYNYLKTSKVEIFNRINEKIDLDTTYQKWVDKVDKIYLPQPREEDLVIAQDDTYLDKEIIDLTKYKNQENVGSMFKDYNLEQVNQIQVTKQADVLILFYLLENLFSKDVKIANFNYYEPKTLHDSSLSLSTHCVLANDLQLSDLAYQLFRKASEIDLGPNMKTSDHGIHAASLGGIWQCIVNGFGGIRMLDGKLRVEPQLPKEWENLSFNIYWHGDKYLVNVTQDKINMTNLTLNNPTTKLIHKNQELEFTNEIEIHTGR